METTHATSLLPVLAHTRMLARMADLAAEAEENAVNAPDELAVSLWASTTAALDAALRQAKFAARLHRSGDNALSAER
jgi:hypothetical protein